MNAVSPNGGTEDNRNLPPDPFQSTGSQTQSPPHDATDPGNIDKIRDILFGSNIRDYEQRFARLEELLKKESSELRESARHQLETLEAFVHKELAALEVRLNAERDERSQSHSHLAADLSGTSASILKKIGEVENQEAQAKREIRNDLLQQSKIPTSPRSAESIDFEESAKPGLARTSCLSRCGSRTSREKLEQGGTLGEERTGAEGVTDE